MSDTIQLQPAQLCDGPFDLNIQTQAPGQKE